MAEKIQMYLIGFDENFKFESDIYCLKKIKDLVKCGVKLDAVFTKNFEKFPSAKKYCSNHQVEAININPDEAYFVSIIQYSVNNLDKKNLATLISENNVSRLNWFFKQDKDFNPHIF